MVKRKAEAGGDPRAFSKKGKSSKAESVPVDVKASFREGLFDKAVEAKYREEYAASTPYKHAVIHTLISDPLLRRVRTEALQNLHFTPKETDIYRLHQSGDLANLDGLPRTLQSLLPSLRQLRDALYSKTFRAYICAVTGCGALSGTKTDMAINVYTPGSHLLTHDDVIGSRRVSYILYLTSPDAPWQESWGGALRLYPTRLAEDGVTRVPEAMWSRVLPPAWNQLSFFEVQPGLSFHDVEEVYDGPEEEGGQGGKEERVRMAISGWFHIPQEGEEGYIPGLEAELAAQSSLQQLQSKSDTFDLPKPQPVVQEPTPKLDDDDDDHDDDDDIEPDDTILSEPELNFLLQYISPIYLTPDTLEDLRDAFAVDSSVQITHFLCKPFAARLKSYITSHDAHTDTDTDPGPNSSSSSSSSNSNWSVALPPHKQRYLYLQLPPHPHPHPSPTNMTPLEELLQILFPSRPFRKLLQLATGTQMTPASNLLARRFRRGLDYTLATGYGGGAGEIDENGEGDGEAAEGEGEGMRVEVCLGVTPSRGWGGEEEEEEEEEQQQEGGGGRKGKGKGKVKVPKPSKFDDRERTIGGYEMYMAGDSSSSDSDSDSNSDSDSDSDSDSTTTTSNTTTATSNTASKPKTRRRKKKPISDPAIYKTAGDGDDDGDDDSVLFTMPAAWNRCSIVLRDSAVLRFVKYVSRSAGGDRWDVVGEWSVGGGGAGGAGAGGEEEEWRGIEMDVEGE